MAGPNVAIGPRLGSLIDADTDGHPSINALGDDTNGVDDENGVQFWGGNAVRITVSAACKLNAWVDFDANGSFGGPSEQIYTNQALSAGTTSLVFTVPATAVKDAYLYSRWRVTSYTLPVGYYYGEANDGEVEDYNKPFISSCYGTGDPCYADWVTVGRPYCWCFPRQCHGDADGYASSTKAPFYWVSAADLTILKSGWNKTVDQLAGTDICADFDRRPSSSKAPFYRVTAADLTILKANWNISGKPDANCVPGTKTPPAPPME
jgi:hypothetical protein